MDKQKLVKILNDSINFLDKLNAIGVTNAANIVNIYQCITAVKNELQKEEADEVSENENK